MNVILTYRKKAAQDDTTLENGEGARNEMESRAKIIRKKLSYALS